MSASTLWTTHFPSGQNHTGKNVGTLCIQLHSFSRAVQNSTSRQVVICLTSFKTGFWSCSPWMEQTHCVKDHTHTFFQSHPKQTHLCALRRWWGGTPGTSSSLSTPRSVPGISSHFLFSIPVHLKRFAALSVFVPVFLTAVGFYFSS